MIITMSKKFNDMDVCSHGLSPCAKSGMIWMYVDNDNHYEQEVGRYECVFTMITTMSKNWDDTDVCWKWLSPCTVWICHAQVLAILFQRHLLDFATRSWNYKMWFQEKGFRQSLTSNSRWTRYSASTLQATSEEQVHDFGPETQSAQLEVSSPISDTERIYSFWYDILYLESKPEKSWHVFSSNCSDPKCQEKATQSSVWTQSSWQDWAQAMSEWIPMVAWATISIRFD